MDISSIECVILLDPFSLVEVGVYKRSFTCHITVLVELVDPHFESAKWVASFGK